MEDLTGKLNTCLYIYTYVLLQMQKAYIQWRKKTKKRRRNKKEKPVNEYGKWKSAQWVIQRAKQREKRNGAAARKPEAKLCGVRVHARLFPDRGSAVAKKARVRFAWHFIAGQAWVTCCTGLPLAWFVSTYTTRSIGCVEEKKNSNNNLGPCVKKIGNSYPGVPCGSLCEGRPCRRTYSMNIDDDDYLLVA